MAEVSPGLILIVGALLVPFLRGRLCQVYLVALSMVAFLHLISLENGAGGQMSVLGLSLTMLRVDKLSSLFGYVFLIACFLATIYSLHLRDKIQHVSGLVYAGGALGAVFAGDLVTLFIFWEVTAIASVFLIFAARSHQAYRAGMRYILVQVGSGVLLLSGVLLHYRATGSLAFEHLGLVSPGTTLIFLGFGIKAAFPLLHSWLEDAYPEATVTGTVFLSAFSTKLAIYALARGYAGTELLVPIGAAMTAFPIFYAVIENDLRRVLAYSLNNQLGFMVVGIGVGTELALNGAVAHAFAHIIYKALLFMSMGAVLYRVGTIKGSELGGLYKSMPWTAVFCMVGAASISAFPLFSGFVAKSMIMSAAMKEGYLWTWLILMFASAGVFHHAGIKIPYFAFFAHDSGKRCAEAPANMLVAMALAAVLCIGIGVLPLWFMSILPFEVPYAVYTLDHVVGQMQLLLFSALAFAILMRTGIYPPELPSTNLDVDWFYRRLLLSWVNAAGRAYAAAFDALAGIAKGALGRLIGLLRDQYGPDGRVTRTQPAGAMVFWITALLGAALIVNFI